MPLRPQRGTDPYRANVIASITVDLPEPVGPTRAKNSASPKSTCASSRNEAKPCMSSVIGRIAVPFLLSGPKLGPAAASAVSPVLSPAPSPVVTSSCSSPNRAATRGSLTSLVAQ